MEGTGPEASAAHESPHPRLMSVREASRYLGLSASQLYGVVAARRMPYVRVAGHGRIWLEREALDRWIAENRVPATEQGSAPAVKIEGPRPAKDISEWMPATRRFA